MSDPFERDDDEPCNCTSTIDIKKKKEWNIHYAFTIFRSYKECAIVCTKGTETAYKLG